MAKAISAQQESLDSLAQVVLDNCMALGYMVAKQGRVCVVAILFAVHIYKCLWRSRNLIRKKKSLNTPMASESKNE